MRSETIECTKEEWHTFFSVDMGSINIENLYAFIANKFKLPNDAGYGLALLTVLVSRIVSNRYTFIITIKNFGTLNLTYSKQVEPVNSVPILPKNYRPSYPGSRHFQTKKTKEAKYQGKL